LVEKGKYQFEDLTSIYCIGFLAKEIFPKSKEYYHFARLKNQKGEELDDQITHIIVEISKFDKKAAEIQTDLDKLIYIMKNLEHIKGLDFEMMLAKAGSIVSMEKEEKEREREKNFHEKAMETAKNLKDLGVENEIISQATGLSID